MVKAAYVHIPFCEYICHYCDFNKIFIQNQPVEAYLDYLNKEIEQVMQKHDKQKLDTIFIGGGTPTALNEPQLTMLMESINRHLLPLDKDIEFTVEANPGDLSYEKMKLLKSFGVNRFSIGVQSFNDRLLEKIGRVHRKEDVFRTVEDAKKAGFDNLSIDLMFGLPGQTIEDFETTLDLALSLNVQHFSAYSLIIEPKTVFYNLVQKGKLPLPPQEDEARMYEILMDRMESRGFHQYEISNFSLPGMESKHNLTYWENEEYFGFGAGAHGYVNGMREVNAGPLKKYMSLIDETGSPVTSEHHVTANERMEEELFLGLRKTAGISKGNFKEKFGLDLSEVFSKPINEQKEKGLLEETDSRIFLSVKGRLLGNEVFQSFIGI
ncbi:oxygen-independent coproporphyrinogen III oxidase [Bacillus sp. FJAT-42376]|uniref:radical SAM family heme chaperone HemW n=1 Tax=Bacillus sp. FJAT-42376 TaxID=2014076 RepID=UPI000F4DB0AE|nr:radical SAM family heme chaperone HemW [Bacillus sp. FJAT-42376]AZB43684.1 oxygen-independent coproporphyrinogen III oxidase [Bacillus sp. FJAT-42376]